MPAYRVTINGRNFLSEIDGVPQRLGFYTTRDVEAAGPKEAETAAIRNLRESKKLQTIVKNPADDPLRMFVEEIVAIAAVDRSQPEPGFAWYSEEDDDDAEASWSEEVRRKTGMALADLTQSDREVVRRCLMASAHGPFFPEWEFHSLFGVTRAQLAGVLAAWPVLAQGDEVACLCVKSALNNLSGCPHGMVVELQRDFGLEKTRILEVFDRLQLGNGL